MTWKEAIEEFKYYLTLERSLSPFSISAYLSDVNKLAQYLDKISPLNVTSSELKRFLEHLGGMGIAFRTAETGQSDHPLLALKKEHFLIVSEYQIYAIF
jgi:integrase/recombinase XerD